MPKLKKVYVNHLNKPYSAISLISQIRHLLLYIFKLPSSLFVQSYYKSKGGGVAVEPD